jgi:hypothetical protein
MERADSGQRSCVPNAAKIGKELKITETNEAIYLYPEPRPELEELNTVPYLASN